MKKIAITRVTKSALNVEGDHFPTIGMRTAHRLQHQRRLETDPEYAAKHGPENVEPVKPKRTRKPAATGADAPAKPRSRARKAVPVEA